MEKAVDIVVARRFKARGMSWFRRGVSALVRLRLLRLNGMAAVSNDEDRGLCTAITTASIGAGALDPGRRTVTARTTPSSGGRSRTMSAGENSTSGSCGPPTPSRMFERSCPTTSKVPPGATAVAARA